MWKAIGAALRPDNDLGTLVFNVYRSVSDIYRSSFIMPRSSLVNDRRGI